MLHVWSLAADEYRELGMTSAFRLAKAAPETNPCEPAQKRETPPRRLFPNSPFIRIRSHHTLQRCSCGGACPSSLFGAVAPLSFVAALSALLSAAAFSIRFSGIPTVTESTAVVSGTAAITSL